MGHAADQSSDTFKILFEVNVIGTLNGINVVVPGMKERSLSEGIRQELSSSNIRLTTIAPGAIETPLLNGNDNPAFKKRRG